VLAPVACILAVLPTIAAEDSWEFRAGAGIAVTPVYEGAGAYILTPLPDLGASWTKGPLALSVSTIDGIGISTFHSDIGIMTHASVNTGSSREADFLPDVEGPLVVDIMAGYVTPLGIVGAVVRYRPVQTTGPGKRRDGELLHGFQYSVLYYLPLSENDRLSLGASALLDFMDGRYAKGWYSVHCDTAHIEQYDADAGIRATSVALDLELMITERIGLRAQVTETIPLGDAADSPYTDTWYQTNMTVTTFYSF